MQDLVFDPRSPRALQTLREMGEWMALGFYEGIDLPWPRGYGLGYRRLYEHMPVRLREGAMLLPCEPFPIEATLMREPGAESWYWAQGERAHHATGFVCDFMHHSGVHLNREMVARKKEQFPQHGAFIDALVADLGPRLPHFGGYTHSNPDIRRVVNEGFGAMERELDEQIALATDAGECALLATLKDYCAGVRAFHRRAAEAIAAAAKEREELRPIAQSFAHCFVNPARTFLEGLLAVHFAWLLDGCDSIGRVDQALGDLFEADIASGRLELGFARRLLDELFMQVERFNGWNMQIGGARPDGGDGANRLTRELLLACGRNKIRRPNMALRIGTNTPDEVLETALDALANGTGRPALYNDDAYVRSLLALDLGLTPEDAREYGFGGCTETMIAGLSNVGSLEGAINLAKALELAIFDGRDPLSGQQVGPHTGTLSSMTSFADLVRAVERQIDYMTHAFVSQNRKDLTQRFTRGDPKPYRTMFTRDCVKRRKSFEAGGARYNWAVVTYAGIANLIDGLAAVRKCVFEAESVSADELLAALRANFVGHEHVHRRLMSAPKFGNDDPYVDEPGSAVLRHACEELLSHETPRGGRYVPSCILFVTYGDFGRQVGALPDGKRCRAPVADSMGPSPGNDTHGPTAMLKSVARLPLHLAVGTPVVNIRVQKRMLASADGRRAMASLVRGFFALGGLQLQISVLSKDDMLAAKKEPAKYRDLIVRIGGYSEYFTKIGPDLQDTVIARTEHGM